jgi:3D (Asp-Asp-Asp) domain-containing protein/peptidoglycan hydrolase CwlO-like protein
LIKIFKINLIKITVFLLLALSLCIEFQFLKPSGLEALTLNELSSQIAALSDEEESLIEEILAVESLIETKKNEIINLTQTISGLEQELDELVKQRLDLEKSMDLKKTQLSQRAIYSYKYGKNNVIKLLTGARDINEFVKTIYLFRNIMRRDAQLIEALRLDKESYDRIMRKSEEKKKEMQSVKKERQKEQATLEENLDKDEYLLDKVKKEKANVVQTLAAIKERIARIQPAGITLSGEVTMVATAYYAGGGGLNGNGITATGLRARKGIVAVDPRTIRLGTRVFIEGYGEAIAADTGGWIKGNRIDLCFDSLEECYRYGRRKIYVYLVE